MKRLFKGYLQFSLILLMVFVFFGVIVKANHHEPRFRIAHVAPGIPNLTVRVNDIVSFRDVVYRQISDYIPVRIGDNTFDVRLSGPSPDSVVDKTPQPLEENHDYTLVIAGTLGHVVRWPLVDENELPGTGTSSVRIVHASFDTPTAEICLNDVCHTLTFQEDSDYFLMDPGTYAPTVHVNSTEKTHIKVPPLVLQNNGVHTVFLVGQMDGPLGLQLLYTYDAGEFIDTYPPPGHHFGNVPGGVNPPAPLYPPITGAFLSLRAIGIIVGAILVLVGGIGFWLTRH